MSLFQKCFSRILLIQINDLASALLFYKWNISPTPSKTTTAMSYNFSVLQSNTFEGTKFRRFLDAGYEIINKFDSHKLKHDHPQNLIIFKISFFEAVSNQTNQTQWHYSNIPVGHMNRGGFKNLQSSKMELFVTIRNG